MAAQQQLEQQDGPTSSFQLAAAEQVLHRLFDVVYSEGDLRVTEEVVGDTLRAHCAGTDRTYRGVSGLKAHAARLRNTFFGLTIEVNAVDRFPDGFVAELTATGRFERPLGGVQPTCQIGSAGEEPGGPRVAVAGSVEGTMTDGRLVELVFNWDFEALRAQS